MANMANMKESGYGTEHLEDAKVMSTNSDISVDEIYSPREQKRIIHRIDRRLVTMCGIMYCISLMDRTNLGAAAIAGYVFALPGAPSPS